MDGGSPVITSPCPQQQEQVLGSTPGKSRRSWFTFSPHQVPQPKDDEDLPILQLTHFTKKVMVCFDKVRLGMSKTCQLSIENPFDYEQGLELEKFPYKKGFTIPEDRWEFDEMETRILPITWTPSEAGNVRELVTFRCDGAFRVQVILLGTAEEKPQKGKRRRGTLLLKKSNGNVSKAPGKVGGPRRLQQPRAQPQQAPKSTARPRPTQRVVGKENFRRPKEPDMLKEVLNPARQTMIISSKRPLLNERENLPSVRKPDMLKDTQDPARQTMIISKRPLHNGKENIPDIRQPDMLEDTQDPSRQTMIIKKKPCSPQRSPLQERNSLSPFKPLDSSLAEIVNATSPDAECYTKRDTLSVCEGMSPLLQTSFVHFGDINEKTDEPDGAQEVFNDSLDPIHLDRLPQDSKPQSTLVISPTTTDQGSQKKLSKEAQLTVTKDTPSPITPPMKRQSRRALFDHEEGDTSIEDEVDIKRGGQSEITSQEVSGPEGHCTEVQSSETEVDHPDSGSDGHPSTPGSLTSQDSLESAVVSSSVISLASLPGETDNIFPVHESTGRKKLVAKRLSDPKSPPLQIGKKSPGKAIATVLSPTSTNSSVPSPIQGEADLFPVHESVVTKNLTNKRKSDPEKPDNISSKKMKARPSTGTTASSRKPAVITTSRRPVTKKQPIPSAAAAKKAANDSKKAAMTSGPSRGMTRTMMLRRAAAGVTANVSKPKPTKKTKRPVKGVPMAKLNLVKPNKTALPRHPMPFAAKNMFYDERWMEKQEQGFTRWLNYVLTPDVDDCPKDPSCKATKIDAGALFVEANQQNTVALAPSKEDLSLRAYTARRKLNRLRRGACLLFQSEPVIRVIQKVEYEVERGGLKVRPDRKIHADFGIKQKLLNMFLSYNPLWLRIGLETVYGEILPIQSNTDILGLSRFVVQRLLWNPDIAQKYAHPTVPGLYGPGHEECLGQFTLKKFLLLVFFLDRAKLTRLIDHDPCLFCKDSEYKSSRSLLLDFSRDYLQGEGDVTKHLSYYGYVVTHKQTALDEFDFAVDKLSTSLRCGVRLARVVELLTHNWTLSRELRVPAISRLQKIHNNDVALKALKEHGIDVDGGGVNTRAIVDGHREKTLELLWRIIFHFQVEVMLNENQIKEEIAFLKKNLKLQHDLNAMETTLGKTGGMLGLPRGCKDSIEPNVYFKSQGLSLLLQWSQTVCRFYNLQVENFTVSFSDGRALCYLVHHYHPSLLPLKDIKQETTQTQYQRPESSSMSDADDSFDGTWANSYSPSTGKPGEHDRLLANERHNYKMLYEKVRELGGIPMMIKSTEMINTIPDEKVVIVYISYLCARLLDLRTETRAARAIQLKWRAYRLKKRQEERKIQIAAATKIQGAVRDFLTRRRHAKIMSSVIKMQALIRSKMARREAQRLRQEKLMKRQTQAAIVLQKHIKGFLQQTHYHKLKASTIILQSAIRGHLVRQHIRKQHNAANVIQSSYKAHKLAQQERSRYLKMQSAAIILQSLYRGRLARKEARRMRAARTIQAQWRGYVTRRAYSIKKYSAVTIQAWYRMCMVRQEYLEIRKSTLILQHHIRAYLFRKQQARAATTLQALVRGFMARQRVKKMHHCAICIQSNFRAYLMQKRYHDLKQATHVLQVYWRATLVARQQRKSYQMSKGACITIQAWVRGVLARRELKKMHRAATCIQTNYRAHRDFTQYQKMKKSACILQTYWKAALAKKQQAREYQLTKGAVITMQIWVRGFLARLQLKKMNHAATCIQANYRCHRDYTQYQKMKTSACVLQNYWRATLAMKQHTREFQITKGAVLTIQASVRGFLVRQQMKKMHHAATCIQANYRCHRDYTQYQNMKNSAVTLQAYWRSTMTMKQQRLQYQITRGAVITMQAWARGFLVRQELKRQHAAAVHIQARYRAHLCQTSYQKSLSACVALQTYWRATMLARRQSADYQTTRNACIMIQAYARGLLVRKEMCKMHAAAICIQTNFKAHKAAREYRMLKQSVQILQVYWRATLSARQQVTEYQTTRNAAITIQAWVRGHNVRKQLKKMNAAAVCIQSNYRAHRELATYQKMRSSAKIIQVQWRATLLARQGSRSYQLTKGACITIQAWVRGHLVRQQMKKMNAAAVCIQSNFRAYRDHTRYQKMRQSATTIQVYWRATLLARKEVIKYQFSKGACITIQAWVRGCLTRKHIQQMHVAATFIQSNFRCHQAQTCYQQMRKAAVVLQVYWRATLCAREQQTNYNKMKKAAILIQAAFRGKQARKLACEERAARTIQAAFRMHVARSAYLEKKKSSVKIQAQFRAHRAQQAYLKMKSSAIIIQRYYRNFQETRHVQTQYAHTRDGVIKIQSMYRMYVARKSYLEMQRAAITIQAKFRSFTAQKAYQAKKQAATTIQNYYRGVLLTRQIQSGYSGMKKAAIEVQAYYRMYAQRKEYLRLKQAAIVLQAYARGKAACTEYKRMKCAAVVIQTQYRATLVACQQQSKFQYTRGAIITIQAVYRGYKVRKQLCEMVEAAKVLQRYWRATLLTRRTKDEYKIIKDACVTMQAAVRGFLLRQHLKKMHRAATIIQANYRCHRDQVQYQMVKKSAMTLQTYWRATLVMKQQTREYQMTRGAVITIQAYVRGFLVRQQVKKMHHAATCIQANYRCHRDYTQYQKIKNSAITLQTYWRSTMAMRQQRHHYQITRCAVITMQACVRGFLIRQQVKKMHHAATCIQANYRAHRDYTQYQKMKKSACVLQTYWRATLAKKQQAREYQITRCAVITIQAFVRGFLVRQQVKKMHGAATCIQANYRCHSTYTKYQGMKKSACVLQTYWRATLAKKQQAREYQITRGAVISIQASVRGFLVRQQMKKMNCAATCIQANYRCHRDYTQYQAMKKSAVVLQTYWRAASAMKQQARKYQLTRGAVITIQACVRGFLARQQLKKMHRAATCIQANYRCHRDNRHYQNLKTSAIILQTYWRATSQMKQKAREYQITRGAVITIQALARGFLVRQELKKQHAAAVCIQASYRAHLASRSYQEMREAAILLQKYWRAKMLARRLADEYHLVRSSCITIQAHVRGFLVRCQVKKMNLAATFIQANYRAHLLSRRYQTIKNSVVILQTYWRATLHAREQQRQYQDTRESIIKIQALVRGYIVRQEIKRMNTAAVCIQSNFRVHRDHTRYQKMRQSAKTVQVYWRATLLARREVIKYQFSRGACITIQAWVRGCLTRQHIQQMHAAATCIQSKYKCYQAFTYYQEMKRAAIILQTRWRAQHSCREQQNAFIDLKKAAVIIQAAFRGKQGRCAAHRERCARTIQAAYRMHIAREAYLRKKQVAILIQANYRAHIAQQEYQRMRTAALKIQQHYRAMLKMREVKQEFKGTKDSIVKIQSTFRMFVERKAYLMKKQAAVKIQAAFRMHLLREEYKKQKSAAVVIQRYYRNVLLTRQTRRDFVHVKESVIKIQSQYRMFVQRRKYSSIKKAAIVLQAYARGKAARTEYMRIKHAAVVIQSRYRATLAARQQQLKFQYTKGAIVTLQAGFRGCKARKLACQMRAARTIQATYKGWVQRQRYLRLRKSAILVQAVFRGNQTRAALGEKKQRWSAALCIQRAYRGLVARRKFEALRAARAAQVHRFTSAAFYHLSALKIQRTYRNYHMRQLAKQRMNSIIYIQQWWRARLERIRFTRLRRGTMLLQRAVRRHQKIRNEAAVVLQSYARMWLAKQLVKKMKDSALRIQCMWRGFKLRNSIKSKKIAIVRAKVKAANAAATEEKKLCNRTTLALDYLLQYKDMSYIIQALMDLDVVTRLSPTCCERLVAHQAVPVLYTLIRSCNRSQACKDVIKYCVSILLNLVKYPATTHAVFDAPESITTILDLMMMYREKGTIIFCQVCLLLGTLSHDADRAKAIRAMPKVTDKINSIHRLTERKHKMDSKRIAAKNRSLNASRLNSSFLNSSRLNCSMIPGTKYKRRRVQPDWVLGRDRMREINDPIHAVKFLMDSLGLLHK